MTELALADSGGNPRLSLTLFFDNGWQFLLLACLFLLIYAFYAAFEAAVIALDDHELEERAEGGSLSARILVRETRLAGRFISRIHAARIIYLSLSAAAATHGIFNYLLPSISNPSAALRFLIVAALVILFFFLVYVFCDSFAKQQGRAKSKAISYSGVYFYKIITLPVLPFSTLGLFLGSKLAQLFRLENMEAVIAATEEDLRMILNASKDAGHIMEQDQDLIENIFEFDNKSAGEIMTHRTNISAFNVTDSLEDVMKTVGEDQYTRYPVYDETIDNIVGIIHTKDILKWLYEEEDKGFSIESLLRKPVFTPESRIIKDLFQEMQQNRIQMAIVIDEYGGTAGIVTLEDIVEEIVGEIADEYDEEEKSIIRLSEDEWQLDGGVELEDIEDACQIVLPKEDYDTVAGMIIAHLDRIPEEGEKIEIVINRGKFRVEKVQDNRISLVHLQVLPDEKPSVAPE
ncbi:MAG TPA: HlyC/CorC family transporter [Clostridiaceae bacterium]|nr:HlyC/CorC family transporter [Clostridiaceae bacterium]